MFVPEVVSTDQVLAAFLERYCKDRESGVSQDLNHYLGLFPNHQVIVAREYLSLAEPPVSGGLAGHLGVYQIIRKLGQGAQGTVYLAEDSRLGRQVGLKVLTGLGPVTGESLQRFHREAEVASKLDPARSTTPASNPASPASPCTMWRVSPWRGRSGRRRTARHRRPRSSAS
jgi:hypothetical protein